MREIIRFLSISSIKKLEKEKGTSRFYILLLLVFVFS